jgi:ATP-dependent RNA helicase SUPV3L1/SUV3
MRKVEPMTADNEPAPGRLPPSPDFSSLQGLQVVGEGPWSSDDRGDETVQQALALELEARAARFHQAVDASIVLANDGVVRWLGDPIAKLTTGPDLLAPSAIVLADSRLPEGARETVVARLNLWLGALARKLLGPLFSLRELQEGPDAVRDLAARLANALGILERDPIRNQVKAFDQNARAILRKQGVRFGAYYVYVPTVLKPASRALALQLWGLQTPGVDADALSQALAPMASSGRTSMPHDPAITRDGYRVAGFRPCGDRVVRVDIVERLADMIRAAFVHPNSASGAPPRSGFVVNGQMTSLTGCSGDAFSSILRSLGFESAEVSRSEFAAAPAAVPAPVEAQPNTDVPATPVLDTPAVEASADATPPEPPSEADPPFEAPDEPSFGPMDEQPLEIADAAGSALSSSADVDRAGAVDSEQTRPPEAEPPSAPLEASDREKPLPPVEMITVWRPARRPRPPRTQHHRRAEARPPAKPAAAPEADPQPQAAAHPAPHHQSRSAKRRRPWERQASSDEQSATPPAQGPIRNESPRSDEKRRQAGGNRGMNRPKVNSESQPTAAVDPNSPFAKLLELRQLLETQGKNRR